MHALWRRHRLRFALAPAVAGVALAGAACRGPGDERRLQPLTFTRTQSYIEFVARRRERDQTSKVGAGTLSSKERILEQNLYVEGKGALYHPNFLEFSLSALFGLRQEDFEDKFNGRVRRSGDDGPVTEFMFNGQFLRKKPYPLTVFARRYRALTPRPFQSSLETTTNSFGFVWQHVSEKTPISLQFSDTKVTLDPLSERETSGLQRNRQWRLDTSYRINEHNTLSFLYTRQSVDEQPFGFTYDADELTLSHNYQFGPHRRQRLQSQIQYYRQKGTFDVKRFRWQEILRLEHSDTLRSWYQLDFLDRTQGTLSGVPPLEERSWLFTATAEHKLYLSLVSQLHGFVQRQVFNGRLKIRRLGGQLTFNYRKKNRWGTLFADYRARVQSEDRRGSGGQFEVIDEAVTFRDPQPATLANTRILIGTIVVTDEEKTTRYLPGEDFRIRRVADRVELDRIPTGRIADGQVVLVDYVYLIGGDFVLDTVTHDLTLREQFDFGLEPYYRFQWKKQTISDLVAAGILPEDIRAHTFGVLYHRGGLRLSAEYEDHDSTIIPFRALRLTADLRHRFRNNASVSLKIRWSKIKRSLPVFRETKLFTVEGRCRWPVRRGFTVEGGILYRREDDTFSGRDRGIDTEFSLEWKVRETELRVTFERNLFEDDFAKNDGTILFVQMRRYF